MNPDFGGRGRGSGLILVLVEGGSRIRDDSRTLTRDPRSAVRVSYLVVRFPFLPLCDSKTTLWVEGIR